MIPGFGAPNATPRTDGDYEALLVRGMEQSIDRVGRETVAFEHDDDGHHIVFEAVTPDYRLARHRVYTLTDDWCSIHDDEQIIRHVTVFGDRRQTQRRRMLPHVPDAIAAGRAAHDALNGDAPGAVLLDVSAVTHQDKLHLRFLCLVHGANGHGVEKGIDLCIERGANPTPEVVTEFCQSLKGHVDRQIKVTADVGHRPRRVTPAEIDLADYLCDAPLLHLIKRLAGDEWRDLARALIHSDDGFGAASFDFRLSDDTRVEFPPLMQVETTRGVLRGRFRLGSQVRWSRGVLVVQKTNMPTTLVTGLAGENLARVVVHDLLPDDLVIRNVAIGGNGQGSATVSMTIENPLVPFR